MEELTDFDVLFDIIERKFDVDKRCNSLKVNIKLVEAEIMEIVNTDFNFFINNKPPSATHVERTYFPVGLNGELIGPREQVAYLEAESDYLKNVFDFEKNRIEVWRTQQANLRNNAL